MGKVKLFASAEEGNRLIPQGSKKLVKVNEDRFCVMNRNGRFTAFRNECPHLGYPLNEGTINPFNELVCPWHSYRFNLNSGDESNFRCNPLSFVNVAIEEKGIFLIY